MNQNMQRKEIKAIARRQLKRNYPGWKRLQNREKKEIAKKVLDEVVANYDFKKEIKMEKSELLGIELQKITSGMMNIDEMAQFIEKHKCEGRIHISRFETHVCNEHEESRRTGRCNHENYRAQHTGNV